MDSSNNPDSSDIFKKKAVEGLTIYREQLSRTNQELKNRIIELQTRNAALQDISLHLTNISETAAPQTSLVMPNNVTSVSLETSTADLNNKLEQLETIKEAVKATFEEETKCSRQKYYKLLTKDEVFLQINDDVEKATQDLVQTKEITFKECEDEKAKVFDNLKKRKEEFIELKKQVTDMEPIEKELRLQNQNCKTSLEEKFKSLNFKSTEEATADSCESKELLKEISHLKSQLNKN